MYIIAHGTLVQSVPVMIVKLLYSRLHCNIIYCCKLLHWGILGDAGQRESRVRARRVKARISAQPGYGVCDASPAHYVIFDCEPRRSHDHCRTLLPLFTFAPTTETITMPGVWFSAVLYVTFLTLYYYSNLERFLNLTRSSTLELEKQWNQR